MPGNSEGGPPIPATICPRAPVPLSTCCLGLQFPKPAIDEKKSLHRQSFEKGRMATVQQARVMQSIPPIPGGRINLNQQAVLPYQTKIPKPKQISVKINVNMINRIETQYSGAETNNNNTNNAEGLASP
jgi:hypothetical protein